MIAKLASFVVGLFSSDSTRQKLGDTAVDVLRNVTGANDLPAGERLAFVNRFMELTKHQSPTRRNIAIMITVGMMVFTGAYLIACALETAYMFFAVDISDMKAAVASQNLAKIKVAPLVSFQNDMLLMMERLSIPFGAIYGFYFATQTVARIKG